ncbi:hypothetical protein BOX15_Mlig002000g2 [Macrostomum lignano]|uniref:Tc1-like transposase DDE domain-containing protein n=1 Tax=Macrostomum lignano TaxID=282301 RepID=A0A267DQJ8_9PLAT|nr:hypothetical protein BOX15_Mlig002000g2 [Macrostomum lignano]
MEAPAAQRRVAVSQQDRRRLVNAFVLNEDWLNLAEQLNIPRQSARNVIVKFERTGRVEAEKRGGNKPKALSDEMIEALVGFVADTPAATLQDMRRHLMQAFPDWQACTIQTISRALDGQLITVKLLRTIPNAWNADRIKHERREFAKWLMTEGMGKLLVFCDEMGCNVWTARTQGRAAEGVRAVRIVANQRGRNVTMCLAVSPMRGLVYWKIVRGGMTRELFAEFFAELAALVDEPFCLLHDNARAHWDPPAMGEEQEYRPLPPYSPFLNMTERAIAAVKASLKRSLSRVELQRQIGDRNAAAALGITLQEHRARILERELEDCMSAVTQLHCEAWHRESLRYVPRCIAMEDIVA